MTQIVAFTIISAIIIVYLMNLNPELAMLCSIVAGILLTTIALKYLSWTITVIDDLINLTGIDKELYFIILKITAIGYLVEFGAQTVSDFGLKSLADKLIFVGKIIIFTVSLPIIYAVINLISGLLQWKKL